MDRAQAIKQLGILQVFGAPKLKEAVDMAIAALWEQAVQPSEEGNCEQEQSKAVQPFNEGASHNREQWISVKERLPEDERSVLAYYGFGHNGTPDSDMMFTGVLSYFCFDPEPHWQHAGHGLVVTHWMPLPEPPAVQPSEVSPSGNVNRKEGVDHADRNG